MAPNPLSLGERIRVRLFPAKHCELPEAPATFKDVVCFDCTCEFSFLDRLRILVTGKVAVRAKIVCENTVGQTISGGVSYPTA